MLTNGKVLDLLYRQIAPEKILEILQKDVQGKIDDFLCQNNLKAYSDDYLKIQNQPIVDKKHFLDYAETTLWGYSEDEHWLLYEQLLQHRAYWAAKGVDSSCGFLLPLIEFATNHLTMMGGEPVCQMGKVLDWRDAYLCLGQDILVTAYLAWEDNINKTDRKDFTWPVILRVNHQELYEVLRKGMAENHNHLAGGTQSYQVTWCRMMNYPKAIREELRHFQNSNLYSKTHRGEKTNRLDKFDELELAAVIRTILFRALHRDGFSKDISIDYYKRTDNKDLDTVGSGKQRFSSVFDGRTAFAEEYLNSFCMFNNLEDTVDCLRSAYGVRVQVLDENNYCLDYALEETYLRAGKNQNVRIMIGERSFLYRCIRACLDRNKFSNYEKELFYLYIVLQSNFRSEMIQNNNQTGFMNFKNYQDRKDDAWDETPCFGDAIGMALNNRLYTERVTLLEGRMVPKSTAEKNINKVFRSDLAKRFTDYVPEAVWDRKKYKFHPELDIRLFDDASWFYVFHYFKVPDERELCPQQFALPVCRHASHRKLVMEQSKGFVNALRESPYFRCRVRGIDAASDEVFCRPEVFAVGFRYIEAIQQKWNAADDGLLPTSPIRISKTYHAGEDFLDIAGGVRAIDEAIRFLHLEPHSRIGHAIALGVEPEIHYNTKHYEIITTKQERLDDLVWILFRGKELGVRINSSLESELRQEADQLFREVYQKALCDNHWDSNLSVYWCSMKLRGDDPLAYSRGCYKKDIFNADEVNEYLVDTKYRELENYRRDPQIAGLYFYYHFGIEAGCRGNETYIKRISKGYICLMRQIQDAMMREIEERKLIIETNPSSNVLIGTFKDYSLHPIFRFNNRKLYGMGDSQRRKVVQLSVCVNTDDLGVFDTNLEFEYALLYEALQKRREYAGFDSTLSEKEYSNSITGSGYQDCINKEYVYSDQDILEYLDDIREMGMRAVFPTNK